MEFMNIHLTFKELMIICTFLITGGGAAGAVAFAVLRSKFALKSCLFDIDDGTPIYRTVNRCKELEEERKIERRATADRIEKHVQDQIKTLEDNNKAFLKSLEGLFDTQTKQISEVVESAVTHQGTAG